MSWGCHLPSLKRQCQEPPVLLRQHRGLVLMPGWQAAVLDKEPHLQPGAENGMLPVAADVQTEHLLAAAVVVLSLFDAAQQQLLANAVAVEGHVVRVTQ
jgi:hypothetical protein